MGEHRTVAATPNTGAHSSSTSCILRSTTTTTSTAALVSPQFFRAVLLLPRNHNPPSFHTTRMAFNNFWRTFFAITLTAAIFATIVGVLCFIHRRETHRARQAAARALPPSPPPARNGMDLSVLSRNIEFRDSDETLVAPPVSA